MSDNTTLNPGSGGNVVASDDISGVHHQRVKLTLGAEGVSDGDVSDANPMPVKGPLNNAQLRAAPIDVAGPVTDAQMRAAPVPVALDVSYAEDTAHISGARGALLLAVQRQTDGPTADDGDYTVMQLDESGRLKVSVQPCAYPDTTGDITAVQPTATTPVAGGTVTCDVSRASNVMVFCTNTFAGVNVVFEGSLEPTGDNGWFAIQALRTNANTVESSTGVLSSPAVYAWELSVNALARLRVRCTARTSGTQSWRFKLGTYATEPIPAAQVSATQPVSLTALPALAASTARTGFVAGAGIWFDDTSVALAAGASFTGTSRDVTVTATATAMANAASYPKEFRVSAESDQSGTLWVEYSRDNTNWRRMRSQATAAVTGGGQAAEIIVRPSWRYLRAGFTNGATLQARFTLNSLLIAA